MAAHNLRAIQILDVPAIFNGPKTSDPAQFRGRSTEEISEDPIVGFEAIDDAA